MKMIISNLEEDYSEAARERLNQNLPELLDTVLRFSCDPDRSLSGIALKTLTLLATRDNFNF